MARRYSQFLAVLILFVCASFAVAPHAQVARAADNLYNVDNTGDADVSGASPYTNFCTSAPNDCSLRQAIQRANADTGTSEINFNLLTSSDPNYDGSWTIRPASGLPPISAPDTSIIGRSNFLAQPGVIIDGTNVPDTQAIGLDIFSANNVIQRLVIVGFTGDSSSNGFGIQIYGASATNNRIIGNYIGRKPLSNDVVPNSWAGIRIDGASANIIGEPGDAGRNYISGNGENGISLSGANNNTIANNYIGVVVNASAQITPAGNNGFGIQVNNSSNNTIGSTAVDSFNIVSANTKSGIYLANSLTLSNTLVGNYIGVNQQGIAAPGFGNGQDGIRMISGASNNRIISAPNARTIIGANAGYGVFISDGNTRGNSVEGCYIGVGANNQAAPNQQGGVRILNNANGNTIGKSAAGNVISGNIGYGIRFDRTTPAFTNIFSNTVSANIVGLNPNGTTVISNTAGGILLSTGTRENRIGGEGTGEGNIITGNAGSGVVISGTNILSNTITGNLIGLRRSTPSLPYRIVEGNKGHGIQITNADASKPFSNTVVLSNTVAGNLGDGIVLTLVNTGNLTKNTISKNTNNGISLIGSSAISITNNTILTNTLDGVYIGSPDGKSQRIQVTDNSISANGGLGINLDPETLGLPGLPNNPNHDIDAPFNLHINQDGLVTGRVLATKNQPASCITCTIQLFSANPELLDGQGKTKISAPVEISANGYFTATVGSVPGQLALTATDSQGNTSEFGVFTATLGLDIGPARASSAAPGDVISYTHRITNTGTVDFTDLSLSAVSSQKWKTAVAPAAPISLAAGQSKPVTLTLTLPKAPTPSVLAGTIDLTGLTVKSSKVVSATASVTDTTTVASAFKLEVDPTAITGLVMPGKVITYSHTLRNVGNLTGTVVLSASTTPSVGWTTNITPTTITLGPGQESSVNVGVGSPAGSVAGATAKTTIGIQITDPTGQAPIFIVDTTKVSLQPLVTIVPNNEGEVEAGQTITFQHFITNESNGPIKLKLTARKTGLGSTVEFRSATPGVTLGADGSFTLAKGAQLVLLVDVTVPERARTGNSDVVSISLSQEDGTLVGSVQDTVKVSANAFLPRAYLPLIRK